ncbi:MAG TPA: ATP-binding protein [Bryobacteraceae bacterium]|nr:ATP-binding protein [Bryobacteraceae bacterium]
MLEFFRQLFESDFMPHGFCFGWRPDILWLHVSSDAVTALSYYMIPVMLVALVRARRDLAYHWMFTLFGVFILSCGTTHWLAILTLWHPVYRLEGVVKAITALASLPTAIILVGLVPKAIALPSPAQLRAANEKLVREIAERRKAQDEVSRLNDELEQRVAERTRDLERSNQMLREANERLADAEARYRLLFEHNPLPMWVRDPASARFLAVNQAAAEVYGYSRDEFLAMTAHRLAGGAELPARLDGLPQPVLEQHFRKNGPSIYAEVRFREIQFNSAPAWLVLATDVTERKLLEEQLRHSQKMEAVGRLAGGIAHDFNNLLTVILGYTDVAQRRLAAEDPLQRTLSEIQRSAEYAATLTAQLLAFSRKQVHVQHVLDLSAVVTAMRSMLVRVLGEDIDIAFIPPAAACPVRGDEGQLTQVLMNLAVNARDAMPDGGKLTIETRPVEREREDLGRHGVRPAGRYALLVVSDTGSGMDAETQAHLFEPFFTTKETGKGTGLGLSTVYGIVQQHGGWIDVYSEPGHGTTFKIYLPEAGPVPEPVAPTPAAAHLPPAPSATILLVEDQAPLRLLAEDMLSEAGHTVLAAGNGRAALALAEQHAGSIDLLVTDVVMPEMNGPELADRLAQSRPDMMVLYISGYTDHALLHRGALETGTAFLQKPFLPQALLAKVEELLRRRSNARLPET